MRKRRRTLVFVLLVRILNMQNFIGFRILEVSFFKERVGTLQYNLDISLGRVSVHFRLQVGCGKFIGTHNFWIRIR